jgi:hypothetical protein
LGSSCHSSAAEAGLFRADGRWASIREKRLVSLGMTVALLSLPTSLALPKHRRPHVIRLLCFHADPAPGDREISPWFLGNQRTRSARRARGTRFLGRTPGVTG